MAASWRVREPSERAAAWWHPAAVRAVRSVFNKLAHVKVFQVVRIVFKFIQSSLLCIEHCICRYFAYDAVARISDNRLIAIVVCSEMCRSNQVDFVSKNVYERRQVEVCLASHRAGSRVQEFRQ